MSQQKLYIYIYFFFNKHKSLAHFVTGAASFMSMEDGISVNYDGTVTFDLSLTFSQPGPSGQLEHIDRFELIKNTETVAICLPNIPSCNFPISNTNQWWTVVSNSSTLDEHKYCFKYILHQVLSDDRGEYRAQVEGTDPASSSLDPINKSLFVSGEKC